VWDEAIRGTDNAYLSRIFRGRKHLKNAEALAKISQPQLMGEVTLRAGTLPHAVTACGSDCLSHCSRIREEGERTLSRGFRVGSLGLVATQMERYDEICGLEPKRPCNRTVAHAMSLVAKIEGNIAWSYYYLGTSRNAVAGNLAAEKDATTAGLHQNSGSLPDDAASAYYDLNELSTAEATISKALTLSATFNDVSYVVECLQIRHSWR